VSAISLQAGESRSTPSRRRRFPVDRLLDVAYPLTAFGVLLLAWELWVRVTNQPPYIMVPFTDVVQACFDDWDTLMRHTWATVRASIYGYALGSVIGVVLAFLIATLRPAAKGLLPLIVVYHVIPSIAIAPVLSIWFGFGLLPKVLIVANFTFFPVMLNTIIGLRSTQTVQVLLFRSTGAGPLATFFRLRLPNALPQIFVGLKIASTLALIGAVVAEFVSASEGLGYYVLIANGALDTEQLMVGVIYLSVTGMAFFALVQFAEWLATPWHIAQRTTRSR
jgi:NitT/TauT family transport system permease protein